MPTPRRLRAPRGHGEVLADPEFAALPECVHANRRLLERAGFTVDGLPLSEWRSLARHEAFTAARDSLGSDRSATPRPDELSPDAPLILAGHQPELSHPGVWVKHFALNGLARRVSGVPLNLVVDNDMLKSTAIRFPTWDSSPRNAHLQSLPFDEFTSESPYETRGIRNPELFASFAERAAPLWRMWGYEPLLPRAWRIVVAHRAATISEKFAAVRRQFEREWGCHNWELPVSRLARTQAFAHLVRHLVADWPRFREVYNRAVQQYRKRHGIESSRHPVPDLGENELPFWGPVGPEGRRGRAALPLRVEPVALRPRALTLTLFVRLGLGDFFIHGIGGGKYDEVTDAIFREYFGLEAPAYQVLSATLHLPLPTFPVIADDVTQRAWRVRDLHWNPQQHLTDANRERPEVRALVTEKQRLTESEPNQGDRAARREWFRALQRVNERLRPFVWKQLAPAKANAECGRVEAAANAVMQRRDFAWVLYPEAMLREFCQGFLHQ